MRKGILLFARYAFMPNLLGYCGGPDAHAMLEYVAAGHADPGLDDLIRRFQAAHAYLQFIARSFGMSDPLDPRVVEAYWVGNDLLEHVEMRNFFAFVDGKSGPRIPKPVRKYLLGQVPRGARPHHSFHVLDISVRTGVIQENMESLEKCRIGWGIVQTTHDGLVPVRHEPLKLPDGRLALGEPGEKTVQRSFNDRGHLTGLEQGDVVSLHWDWVCDRLTLGQA